MIEYECCRCYKKFDRKSNYETHLKKKKPCIRIENKNTNSNDNQHQNDLLFNENIRENIRENIQDEVIDDETKNDQIHVQKKTIFLCNYCNEKFAQSSSLNRHIKTRCKVKKQDTHDKEEIFQSLLNKIKQLDNKTEREIQQIKKANKNEIKQLKDENTKLKIQLDAMLKHQSNTINNTTNTNSNNVHTNTQNNIKQLNINLSAYGKENLDFLTDDKVKQILNKGFKSVENLVQTIHFDKDHPEHHNMYISNMKDNYIMMFDGDKWTLVERNDTLQQIYEDEGDYLAGKFEELQNQLDESTLKKFGRFLNDRDSDDTEKAIKQNIKLILYNNRKIAEDTKKLLKLDNPEIDNNIINKKLII